MQVYDLILLGFVTLVAAAVRWAFVRQFRHGRVDHHYWIQAAEFFRQKPRLPVELDGRFLLEDRKQSYPPFFYFFLSCFPKRFLRESATALAQAADFLTGALVIFSAWLMGSDGIALAVAALFIGLAPVMVSYNTQVNPRAWGNFFIVVKLLSEAGAVGGGHWTLWVVAAISTALVIVSHKMTTQLMFFLWIPWAFSLNSFCAAAMLPIGLFISTCVTGFRFSVFQWRAHFDIVSFWNRYWPLLGAHAVRASPIYGSADERAGVFHRAGWGGVKQHCVTVGGYAPALLPLPLLAVFDPLPPQWLMVWTGGTALFAMMTLLVPSLKCLGGGHYYIFNAIAPSALWWALAINDGAAVELLLCFSALLGTVVALVVGYRRRMLQRSSEDADLEEAIGHLKKLSSARMAIFPVSAAERVAANTSHSVLWGGHGFGFQRLEPIFPVISRPLGNTFARHRIELMLLSRTYWPGGLERLREDGVVSNSQDFGSWTLAFITTALAPISVLVVVRSLHVGGTERHLLSVIPRLRDRGIKIELAVLHPGGALEADFRKSGVPINPLRGESVVRKMQELRSIYLALRPDVIHYFLPEAYLVGGVAALGVDGPVLAMSRRSLNQYQRKHPIAARIERWLHQRMAAVVGNSAAVLADLRAEGVPPGRLRQIPNGVLIPPVVDRIASREKIGVARDALVIVIVANLIPYKGHEDLLDALHRISDDLRPGWRLLCAGRDDGIHSALQAAAISRGIAENVRWLGLRDDVADIIAAADIVVSASHEEGSPNAVLEAMAAGRAVVATAVGGTTELLRDGATGVLVPPRDTSFLASAILTLAASPEIREAMGRAARAHVKERYDIDCCISAYVDLYASLANQARRDP